MEGSGALCTVFAHFPSAMPDFLTAALYKFVALPAFAGLQAPLQSFCEAQDVRGTLLLAEPMANPAGPPDASSDAYFHFYLLAMGAGRLRSPDELRRLMHEAGFHPVERLANAMPIHTQLLVAHKSRCLPS